MGLGGFGGVATGEPQRRRAADRGRAPTGSRISRERRELHMEMATGDPQPPSQGNLSCPAPVPRQR